ncbi:MAG TPA: hypothetical protein VMM57_11770 [Bacteroidota bacterium]|nr:hypothetical protein [Bacteroidota bacterium]
MPTLGYDANGNILSLVRNGSVTSAIDNLTYKYRPNTNRDTLISNSAGTPDTLKYDSNGNVSSDSYHGVAFQIYDIDNHPVSVYMTNGQQYQYGYDADGNRMEKIPSSGTLLTTSGSSAGTSFALPDVTSVIVIK